MDVFRDWILIMCLLFVPEEEELYLLETLVVFSVIFCSFLLIFCGIMLLFSSSTLKVCLTVDCIKFVQFVFSFYSAYWL